jgi:hypothetical protein
VSKILGHKKPELTLKVYTHWSKNESPVGAMADLAAAIRRPENCGSKVVANAAAAEAKARK